MAKRAPVRNASKDRKKFSQTAERTNSRNIRSTTSRGGIRL